MGTISEVAALQLATLSEVDALEAAALFDGGQRDEGTTVQAAEAGSSTGSDDSVAARSSDSERDDLDPVPEYKDALYMQPPQITPVDIVDFPWIRPMQKETLLH